MEEIIILAVHFIGELLFNLLFYWPFDLPWGKRDDKEAKTWVVAVFMAVLGFAIGYGFTLMFSDPFIQNRTMALINRMILPIINGYIAYKIANWRRLKWGSEIDPIRHFICATVFCYGFMIMRYAMTQ